MKLKIKIDDEANVGHHFWIIDDYKVKIALPGIPHPVVVCKNENDTSPISAKDFLEYVSSCETKYIDIGFSQISSEPKAWINNRVDTEDNESASCTVKRQDGTMLINVSESVELKTTMGEFEAFKSSVFNSAIDDALEKLCDKVCDREPCYTATLTKELPRILNNIINTNAQRTGRPPKYRFGSCYVHQKPYVKFGSDFRRELGDLLVLVKRTINGTSVFNSALFQLKKTTGKKLRIPKSGGEDEQLTLYMKWGKLKIDLESEKTTTYDVTPHTVSQGASYMFIRLDRARPKFVVSVPNREMETTPIPAVGYYLCPQSFGNYLYGMVKCYCGRTIASKDDVTDDWSKLIWRVIDLLEDVSCRCKGYGVVTRDNECGDLAFLTGYSEIESFGQSTNEKLDEECDVSGDDGFGVLFIEELNGVENEDQRG